MMVTLSHYELFWLGHYKYYKYLGSSTPNGT